MKIEILKIKKPVANPKGKFECTFDCDKGDESLTFEFETFESMMHEIKCAINLDKATV